MKNKLMLSIALSSFVGLTGAAAHAQTETAATETSVAKAPTSGGKCASGKCGTEKIYGKAEIKHNPQDLMVRTRDGKCGTYARGLRADGVEKACGTNLVSGVCGQ